jgi:hypothetical protein
MDKMISNIPITISERAGIDRINEPVSMGIPFPRGIIKNVSSLALEDENGEKIVLQAEELATWPDGSLKWALLDFQISLKADSVKVLVLKENSHINENDNIREMLIEQNKNAFLVNTGAASFFLSKSHFKPFERVVINGVDVVQGEQCRTIITDESGLEYKPVISKIVIEKSGVVRSTVRIDGSFVSNKKYELVNFFSRINFFRNSGLARVEFTILNPRPAKHIGGLWDLGDPGSIYFKDLSLNIAMADNGNPAERELSLYEDPVPMDYQIFSGNNKHKYEYFRFSSNPINQSNSSNSINPSNPTNPSNPINPTNPSNTGNLLIYQDSSGGNNWKSSNHVNRHGVVKTSFRGYKIHANGSLLKEGLRANPVVTLSTDKMGLSASVQSFWQNFPKALEIDDNKLVIRLFPGYYDDNYELQGGEQKTHTFYLNFTDTVCDNKKLCWIQHPLVPHASPEWYSNSKVINYLIPEKDEPDIELQKLINGAKEGEDNLFAKREIIDEYGWRNFGEFYADHEAVFYEGPSPLVSHYNNQYDCILGTLIQFIRSGDERWFILGDQLCRHVRDIDIYHTDKDRPEFNHGLFWHTEHYLDAETSTHRCFSKKHEKHRDLSAYGGGPASSHNYTSGFLLHYYLTGQKCSMDAVKSLTSFVMTNIDMEKSFCNRIIKKLRKRKALFNNGTPEFVQLEKIYEFDGPGRASGNALNTLLDAYFVMKNPNYQREAETLIEKCISPEDNIPTRNLLDVENRWMYTVFLQALGKYLDAKSEYNQHDINWVYGKESLVRYARWMMEHEYIYLEKPENLQYPNETWAVQELRKCNVFLYASKYDDLLQKNKFKERGDYFYNESVRLLNEFQTRQLTRPVALLLLNGCMHSFFPLKPESLVDSSKDNIFFQRVSLNKRSPVLKFFLTLSLKREIAFIRWHIISKLLRL